MSARIALEHHHRYTAQDLDVFGDPLPWIRARPEMFFRSGRFSPEAAAVELVGEALLCDVLDVTVERLGDWWIVSSSQDWLSAADVEKVFRRIVPFPEAGPNSMRAEVLLAAFCRDVVTQGSGRRLAIAGSPDAALTALFERTCRQGRAVAFRC